MKTTPDVDYKSINTVLKNIFPNILFFPPTWSEVLKEQSDIYLLITRSIIAGNEKTLEEELLQQMIKSGYFKVLFPKDIQSKGKEWEGLVKYIQQGDSLNDRNVLKYFFQQIDEKFLKAFNTSVRKEIKLKDTAATNSFYNELFRNNFFDIESIKEPKDLINCEHSPSSIYECFEYYARKQYTLIRLGREFPIADIHNRWQAELEKKLYNTDKNNNYLWLKDSYFIEHKNSFMAAYENIFTEIKKENGTIEKEINYARKILNKLFVGSPEKKIVLKEETANSKDIWHNEMVVSHTEKILRVIEYLLEGTPETYRPTPYIPQDFVILAGRISGQMGSIHKQVKSIGKSKQYKTNNEVSDISSNDLQNIRNYCKELEKHLPGENNYGLKERDIEQAQIIIKSGTTFEKIELLFKLIQESYFQKVFPKSLEKIQNLYYRMSEIQFPQREQIDDDESDFDIPETKYPGIYEEFENADTWEDIIKQTKKEFNAEDEQDFINFFAEKHNWPLITTELSMYSKQGTHMSERLLFTTYRKNQENISHTLFAYKIRKIMEAMSIKTEVNRQQGAKNGKII